MALPPPRNTAAYPPSTRGSIGSSVVWDEAARARRRSAAEPAAAAATDRGPARPTVSPAPGAPDAVPPAIEARIRAILERASQDPGRMDGIRERVLELVRRAAAEGASDESADALPIGSRQKELQIDVLERRIAKLEASLEETRAAIARTSSRADVDRGIASIYRTVQGLAECDALLETKRNLLVEIYEANLALQKRG